MKNYQAELETLLEARFKVSKNITEHVDIDIAGDLIAGTLLSQILYWFGIGENGRPRVRARHEGELWLAKSRKDWFNELRISPKQVDRGIKILLDKNLIIRSSKNYKWSGVPTTHIRPNYEVYNQLLNEWKDKIKQEIIQEDPERYGQIEDPKPVSNMDLPQRVTSTSPKGKHGPSPKGNDDLPQKVTSITETLSKPINKELSFLKQQQQKEKAQKFVVDVQKEFNNLFNENLTENQAKDLITLAEKYNACIIDKLHNTHAYHLTTPCRSIMASIKYAIEYGDWEINLYI